MLAASPERSCHSLMQPVPSSSGRQGCSTGSQERSAVVTAAAVAERSAAPLAAPITVVDVPLGDRSYPIYIGKGLLDRGDLLRQHIPGKRVLIVTNETIAPLYLQRCALYWPSHVRQPACITAGSSSPGSLMQGCAMHYHRCRAALEGGGSGLQVEEVVLPDGEQHKSLEVLQQVCAALSPCTLWHVLLPAWHAGVRGSSV